MKNSSREDTFLKRYKSPKLCAQRKLCYLGLGFHPDICMREDRCCAMAKRSYRNYPHKVGDESYPIPNIKDYMFEPEIVPDWSY